MSRRSLSPIQLAIEVDGVQRPTRNSNGQPIHQTEEGIRNFWRWFVGSKVVDANGKPLVVYHGTGENFDAFSPNVDPLYYEGDRGVFQFTDNRGTAEAYSKFSGPFGGIPNENPRVIEAYLSLQNPLVHDARIGNTAIGEWDNEGDSLRRFAERGNHDGVIIRPGDGGKESLYIAFRPEQIKSAIGNRGTFDPANSEVKG